MKLKKHCLHGTDIQRLLLRHRRSDKTGFLSLKEPAKRAEIRESLCFFVRQSFNKPPAMQAMSST